jgi:glycosyltransferase involved in cell wall biosynthesis
MGRVDVVHGTNFVVPPARRAATVATVHDLTAVRYPELCTAVSRRYPTLVRRAVDRGAFVHVPSAYVGDEVAATFGVPVERVRVVAHGIDHVIFDASSRRHDGPPYLLALGTVEPRKDYPGLVRAFDAIAPRFPDLRLVIAGEDGWGTAALAHAIAASGHAARIERRRGVDDLARLRLLRGAQLLVFPSVYEGFGFPPLEAMAVGTPVVATAAGAVPQTVGDAAVVTPVGDIDALAEALATTLDDRELRSALRTRGLARAGWFTWARCAAGLMELYATADAAAA